jgi:hypothetical protein
MPGGCAAAATAALLPPPAGALTVTRANMSESSLPPLHPWVAVFPNSACLRGEGPPAAYAGAELLLLLLLGRAATAGRVRGPPAGASFALTEKSRSWSLTPASV